jgi:hypothetical protein
LGALGDIQRSTRSALSPAVARVKVQSIQLDLFALIKEKEWVAAASVLVSLNRSVEDLLRSPDLTTADQTFLSKALAQSDPDGPLEKSIRTGLGKARDVFSQRVQDGKATLPEVNQYQGAIAGTLQHMGEGFSGLRRVLTDLQGALATAYQTVAGQAVMAITESAEQVLAQREAILKDPNGHQALQDLNQKVAYVRAFLTKEAHPLDTVLKEIKEVAAGWFKRQQSSLESNLEEAAAPDKATLLGLERQAAVLEKAINASVLLEQEDKKTRIQAVWAKVNARFGVLSQTYEQQVDAALKSPGTLTPEAWLSRDAMLVQIARSLDSVSSHLSSQPSSRKSEPSASSYGEADSRDRSASVSSEEGLTTRRPASEGISDYRTRAESINALRARIQGELHRLEFDDFKEQTDALLRQIDGRSDIGYKLSDRTQLEETRQHLERLKQQVPGYEKDFVKGTELRLGSELGAEKALGKVNIRESLHKLQTAVQALDKTLERRGAKPDNIAGALSLLQTIYAQQKRLTGHATELSSPHVRILAELKGDLGRLSEKFVRKFETYVTRQVQEDFAVDRRSGRETPLDDTEEARLHSLLDQVRTVLDLVKDGAGLKQAVQKQYDAVVTCCWDNFSAQLTALGRDMEKTPSDQTLQRMKTLRERMIRFASKTASTVPAVTASIAAAATAARSETAAAAAPPPPPRDAHVVVVDEAISRAYYRLIGYAGTRLDELAEHEGEFNRNQAATLTGIRAGLHDLRARINGDAVQQGLGSYSRLKTKQRVYAASDLQGEIETQIDKTFSLDVRSLTAGTSALLVTLPAGATRASLDALTDRIRQWDVLSRQLAKEKPTAISTPSWITTLETDIGHQRDQLVSAYPTAYQGLVDAHRQTLDGLRATTSTRSPLTPEILQLLNNAVTDLRSLCHETESVKTSAAAGISGADAVLGNALRPIRDRFVALYNDAMTALVSDTVAAVRVARLDTTAKGYPRLKQLKDRVTRLESQLQADLLKELKEGTADLKRAFESANVGHLMEWANALSRQPISTSDQLLKLGEAIKRLQTDHKELFSGNTLSADHVAFLDSEQPGLVQALIDAGYAAITQINPDSLALTPAFFTAAQKEHFEGLGVSDKKILRLMGPYIDRHFRLTVNISRAQHTYYTAALELHRRHQSDPVHAFADLQADRDQIIQAKKELDGLLGPDSKASAAWQSLRADAVRAMSGVAATHLKTLLGQVARASKVSELAPLREQYDRWQKLITEAFAAETGADTRESKPPVPESLTSLLNKLNENLQKTAQKGLGQIRDDLETRIANAQKAEHNQFASHLEGALGVLSRLRTDSECVKSWQTTVKVSSQVRSSGSPTEVSQEGRQKPDSPPPDISSSFTPVVPAQPSGASVTGAASDTAASTSGATAAAAGASAKYVEKPERVGPTHDVVSVETEIARLRQSTADAIGARIKKLESALAARAQKGATEEGVDLNRQLLELRKDLNFLAQRWNESTGIGTSFPIPTFQERSEHFRKAVLVAYQKLEEKRDALKVPVTDGGVDDYQKQVHGLQEDFAKLRRCIWTTHLVTDNDRIPQPVTDATVPIADTASIAQILGRIDHAMAALPKASGEGVKKRLAELTTKMGALEKRMGLHDVREAAMPTSGTSSESEPDGAMGPRQTLSALSELRRQIATFTRQFNAYRAVFEHTSGFDQSVADLQVAVTNLRREFAALVFRYGSGQVHYHDLLRRMLVQRSEAIPVGPSLGASAGAAAAVYRYQPGDANAFAAFRAQYDRHTAGSASAKWRGVVKPLDLKSIEPTLRAAQTAYFTKKFADIFGRVAAGNLKEAAADIQQLQRDTLGIADTAFTLPPELKLASTESSDSPTIGFAVGRLWACFNFMQEKSHLEAQIQKVREALDSSSSSSSGSENRGQALFNCRSALQGAYHAFVFSRGFRYRWSEGGPVFSAGIQALQKEFEEAHLALFAAEYAHYLTQFETPEATVACLARTYPVFYDQRTDWNKVKGVVKEMAEQVRDKIVDVAGLASIIDSHDEKDAQRERAEIDRLLGEIRQVVALAPNVDADFIPRDLRQAGETDDTRIPLSVLLDRVTRYRDDAFRKNDLQLRIAGLETTLSEFGKRWRGLDANGPVPDDLVQALREISTQQALLTEVAESISKELNALLDFSSGDMDLPTRANRIRQMQQLATALPDGFTVLPPDSMHYPDATPQPVNRVLERALVLIDAKAAKRYAKATWLEITQLSDQFETTGNLGQYRTLLEWIDDIEHEAPHYSNLDAEFWGAAIQQCREKREWAEARMAELSTHVPQVPAAPSAESQLRNPLSLLVRPPSAVPFSVGRALFGDQRATAATVSLRHRSLSNADSVTSNLLSALPSQPRSATPQPQPTTDRNPLRGLSPVPLPLRIPGAAAASAAATHMPLRDGGASDTDSRTQTATPVSSQEVEVDLGNDALPPPPLEPPAAAAAATGSGQSTGQIGAVLVALFVLERIARGDDAKAALAALDDFEREKRDIMDSRVQFSSRDIGEGKAKTLGELVVLVRAKFQTPPPSSVTPAVVPSVEEQVRQVIAAVLQRLSPEQRRRYLAATATAGSPALPPSRILSSSRDVGDLKLNSGNIIAFLEQNPGLLVDQAIRIKGITRLDARQAVSKRVGLLIDTKRALLKRISHGKVAVRWRN